MQLGVHHVVSIFPLQSFALTRQKAAKQNTTRLKCLSILNIDAVITRSLSSEVIERASKQCKFED